MFKIDVDNINGKTESLYVYGDESILTELETNNVLINFNCRQGHCGSCILRLVKVMSFIKTALFHYPQEKSLHVDQDQ